MRLFDAEGRRLYLTEEERRAFVLAAAKAPREVRTFCGVLHATGCRVSEALALTPDAVDLSAGSVSTHAKPDGVRYTASSAYAASSMASAQLARRR